jgi:hypothetical protein
MLVINNSCHSEALAAGETGESDRGTCFFRVPHVARPLRGKWDSVSTVSERVHRAFISRSIVFLSAALMRLWYRRPSFLNQANTSASILTVIGFFRGR